MLWDRDNDKKIQKESLAYLTSFNEAPKTCLGVVRIMLGLSNKTVACFRLSAGGTSEEKNSSEDWGNRASTRPSPFSFLFFTTLGEAGR